MGDDVDSDDHLARIAKANGKAPNDRHDVTHTQTMGGTTVDNRMQIATPVAIAAIVCLFVAGILGGIAVGTAFNANDKAGQARMEARLAQEDLLMLRAAVRASGIHVETAQDHD